MATRTQERTEAPAVESAALATEQAPAAPAGGLFPIRDLTRRLGASKRVVEHAEAKGLLQPAGRTALGHKLYSEDQEQTLRLVLRLYEFGFSADRIRTLLHAADDALPALVAEHGRWLTSKVEEARRRLALYERERDALLEQVRQHRQQQRTGDVSRSEGTAPPDGAARAGRSRRRDVQVAA